MAEDSQRVFKCFTWNGDGVSARVHTTVLPVDASKNYRKCAVSA